jgi:hypothetical protein
LLGDAELSARLGRVGRDRVRGLYSIDRLAEDIERLYLECGTGEGGGE